MAHALPIIVGRGRKMATASALWQSSDFTRPWRAMASPCCCPPPAVLTIPAAIADPIWSGIGITLVTARAWAFHGQRLDAPALAGLAPIVAGMLVMNLFSAGAAPHASAAPGRHAFPFRRESD